MLKIYIKASLLISHIYAQYLKEYSQYSLQCLPLGKEVLLSLFKIYVGVLPWVLDPLELELQTGVSCPVGAGTRTQVLWKQLVLSSSEPSLQPQEVSFNAEVMD